MTIAPRRFCHRITSAAEAGALEGIFGTTEVVPFPLKSKSIFPHERFACASEWQFAIEDCQLRNSSKLAVAHWFLIQFPGQKKGEPSGPAGWVASDYFKQLCQRKCCEWSRYPR